MKYKIDMKNKIFTSQTHAIKLQLKKDFSNWFYIFIIDNSERNDAPVFYILYLANFCCLSITLSKHSFKITKKFLHIFLTQTLFHISFTKTYFPYELHTKIKFALFYSSYLASRDPLPQRIS